MLTISEERNDQYLLMMSPADLKSHSLSEKIIHGTKET